MPVAVNRDQLTHSVLAVPPLARNADLSINETQNTKLIRHLEAGGIRTLLYGGNANFYHVALSEYDRTLSFLAQIVAAEMLVIPSVGPAYGTMMDQAKVLRRHRFPTAMVLPQQGMATQQGVETGVRSFVQAAGIPALLYIKQDGYIEPEQAARLAGDGIISGVKYAIVRDDPSHDPYLKRLTNLLDHRLLISGIGEQPATTHMRDFGLAGFTSGCVCIAPRLSTAMLAAIRSADWDQAERIRLIFKPLEDLRNAIHPVRVLHEAVRLAGIADTGPLLPLLSRVDESEHPRIQAAARKLLEADRRSVI